MAMLRDSSWKNGTRGKTFLTVRKVSFHSKGDLKLYLPQGIQTAKKRELIINDSTHPKKGSTHTVKIQSRPADK